MLLFYSYFPHLLNPLASTFYKRSIIYPHKSKIQLKHDYLDYVHVYIRGREAENLAPTQQRNSCLLIGQGFISSD